MSGEQLYKFTLEKIGFPDEIPRETKCVVALNAQNACKVIGWSVDEASVRFMTPIDGFCVDSIYEKMETK